MAVVTVAEIMLHADAFERLLAEFYEKVSEKTQRDGVRLLTDYMSRHRRRIAEVLAKLSPEQLSRVLTTPLRYDPEVADCRCFDDKELSPDATTSQVLDAAVELDGCLIRLYRQSARQAGDMELRELFESLVRAEWRDQIELKKIKAMDYF